MGVKPADISFSWKNLYSYNKELIDSVAKRYSFVEEPCNVFVKDSPKILAKNRLHPTFDRGFRKTPLKSGEQVFLLSRYDCENLKEGDLIRLMGAYNIEITSSQDVFKADYHSQGLEEARKNNARLLNWVTPENSTVVKVLTTQKTLIGFGEKSLKNLKVGEVVQFERVGFARIDGKNDEVVAVFSHK